VARPLVVVVTVPPAAGKTTIADRLPVEGVAVSIDTTLPDAYTLARRAVSE
jgi:adenylylsulfate kinase-like enzyme